MTALDEIIAHKIATFRADPAAAEQREIDPADYDEAEALTDVLDEIADDAEMRRADPTWAKLNPPVYPPAVVREAKRRAARQPHGDTNMTRPITVNVGPAWPVVAHRLGVPDAIADALTDGDEESPPVRPESWDDVCAAASDLACRLSPAPHVAECSDLDVAILVDCLDGSTYFADWREHVADGEANESTMRRHLRAGRALATTLSALTGAAVELSEG